METEKIKTDLLRMLKDFMYGAPTNLEIFADKVINLFESQFKQPTVSVMPSEEEIEKCQVKNIAEFVMSCTGDTRHETMDWLHKNFIVLRRNQLLLPSKERETAIEFAKFILQNKSNKQTLIDLDASYINFIKYRNDTKP